MSRKLTFTNLKFNFALLPLALSLALLCTTATNAQTTAFTYQGRLTDNSMPASGTYNMQFKLFDAAGDNNQIGSTITNPDVPVTNGVFTVSLNFGASAFANGSPRFLEITVGNSLLSPRHPVTSVPYAVRALKANSADNATNAVSALNATNATNLGYVAASQYVQTNDARLTDARTPTAGSTNYIQNGINTQFASFAITGSGRLGNTLTANAISSVTQYNIGDNRVLGVAGINNTFAGINAGAANTTGNTNSFFGASAGAANKIGNNNSFYGTFAGSANTSGANNSFFGKSTGGDNTTGSANTFVGGNAGAANTTGANNTFVGTNTGAENLSGNNNSFFGKNAGANSGSDYNTLIGAGTDVVNPFIEHGTAIGAGAIAGNSNSITLGRNGGPDTVIVKGKLVVGIAADGGVFPVCRNFDGEIALCSSSLRYKTNIASFNFGLNLINRLQPITFDWKNGGMHDLGLGAEDVAAIEPLLVTRNAKGEVEGVKYDRIGVVLINAVKEQQAQIQGQQAQVQSLQALILRQNQQLAQQQTILNSLRQLVCEQRSQTAVCNK
jgi:hypothetical protein